MEIFATAQFLFAFGWFTYFLVHSCLAYKISLKEKVFHFLQYYTFMGISACIRVFVLVWYGHISSIDYFYVFLAWPQQYLGLVLKLT